MSGAGLPCIARSTTDIVHVRTHGPVNLYAGSYSDADLQRWAVSPSGKGQGRDGLVDFDKRRPRLKTLLGSGRASLGRSADDAHTCAISSTTMHAPLVDIAACSSGSSNRSNDGFENPAMRIPLL